MEFTVLAKNCIKLKGKQSSVIIDPQTLTTKNAADAVVFFSERALDEKAVAKIEGQRLLIEGPGEYEVGGIKISGIAHGETLEYIIRIDGLEILVARGELVRKDSGQECPITVLLVEDTIETASLTALAPRVVILYGEKAKEGVKSLGKDEVVVQPKYQTTLEKLPQEMEVIVLASN